MIHPYRHRSRAGEGGAEANSATDGRAWRESQ